MAGAIVSAVVLALAALAAWRVLRRPRHDFCALCSCASCPKRGRAPCHCRGK